MVKSAAFFSLLLVTAASLALAQEAPYSQTLNEQLKRVQAGQPPVPLAGQKTVTTTTTVTTAVPSAGKSTTDWPADAAAQPIAAPAMVPRPVAPTGEIIDSLGGGAIPPLPLELQTSTNGTQYLTGGVGDEELAQLKSVEANYNLQALAAGIHGEFVGGLTIRIWDASNTEVLSASNVGPYFYTRLPPGKYTVEMTNTSGVSQRSAVTLPVQGAAKPVFRFPVVM